MVNKYIFTKGEKYIAVDFNSGYPCETDNYMLVRVWASKEDALFYKSMFKDPKYVLRKVEGLKMSLPIFEEE